MATASINDQLVFRVDTVAGESSVTITIPRACTFQFASTWGASTGVNGADIVLTRIRTGVPDQVLFDRFYLDQGVGSTSTQFSGKNFYSEYADLLEGDQLLLTKSDATAAGSIFIYAFAPGAGVKATAVV